MMVPETESGDAKTRRSGGFGFVESAGSKSRSLNVQTRLLLQECPSRQALFEKVLKLCNDQFAASVARIDYLVGAEKQCCECHDPRMPSSLANRFQTDYLTPLSQEVISSSDAEPQMKRYERGDQKMTLLSAPVVDLQTGQPVAAVTMMFGGGALREEVALPRLDGITAVVSAVLMARSAPVTRASVAAREGAAAPARESSSPTTAPEATAEWQQHAALGKASQYGSLREFGYSIVNSLCGQVRAEQVFFGVVRQQRIVVEAISGTADFKANSPAVALARQAMEECMDHGRVVSVQHAQLPEMEALSIHRQWSTETGNACVCSIPLLEGTQTVGVISIRRTAANPFRSEELEKLQQMIAPYGSAIRVVDKASRSVGMQLKTAAGESARKTFGPGAWGRRLMMGCLAVAMVWFLFGSMIYRPLCRTRVVAADLRHFSAPFNGRLKRVYVRAGQEVSAGELLAEFDTADLWMELNRLTRQIRSTQVEFRQAMEDDNLAQAAFNRSQISVLQAEAATIQKQIRESRIMAPSEGTVLLTDLEQRVGQTFAQGEQLLQFAAAGEWLLEIEVPDDIASYVSPEQAGTFAAASFPTERQPFEIHHMDGAATTVQDRNVFIARASLQSRPDWMRSGMEGTAQVTTVDRPVWWVALHRVVDWARLHFWI